MHVVPDRNEVRTEVEAVLLALDPAAGVELLGTVATGDLLFVVVRDRTTGEVHRTLHDLTEIADQAEAVTAGRMVDEVVHRAVNYPDLVLRGVDDWGVRDWG